MAPPKRMVSTPDGPREAVSVEVEQASEVFNTYRLADGNTIRLKTVVLDVVKIVDVKDDLGNPVYQVQHRVLMTVKPSE